jgi:sortase A
MGKFLKKHLATMILTLILLVGLCLLLYPTVADWWNSFHQSRAISAYVEAVEDLSQAEVEQMLEEAQAYNDTLSRQGIHLVNSSQELEQYYQLLDVSGTGVMGYIEISKINVRLPVYHGTDETVLQIAVGHLAGSSLPVGGEGTHCVLSGHRGLPSAKLFTDLDKLELEDTFTLTVLNQTLTYKVDQIRIVTPDDLSELQIQQGQDYCTLITCTPYGVNSHRMLVRGVRIDTVEDYILLADEAVKIPVTVVIPAVGIPMLLILLIILLLYYRKKTPPKTKSEILDELKK